MVGNKEVLFDLGPEKITLAVPPEAEILAMQKCPPLSHPEESIERSLKNPIDSLPLTRLAREKLVANPLAQAVVVISDATRPVPYRGPQGILWPIIRTLQAAGFPSSRIKILVATGTHRAMNEEEIRRLLDPRVLSSGCPLINHDARREEELVEIGQTSWGRARINRHYVEADLKILTGLVESHFMAGASGGRKSICPGLLAEEATFLLHSGPILDSPQARDLNLDGNPVHEASLAVARLAGCDFIVNVTLNSDFQLTGVFSGDMEKAHLAAVEKIQGYVGLPVKKKYDIVCTHSGYVGINHYQAAKGAAVCAPLLQPKSYLLLAGLHPDTDPIGGANYKKMLRLLTETGASSFVRKITSPEWEFVPEQWEAQMWTRILRIIPPEQLIYCSLDIPTESYSFLPHLDARRLVGEKKNLEELVQATLDWIIADWRKKHQRRPRLALLPDGPYGIPLLQKSSAGSSQGSDHPL
jgi:nickel-dependent lactate racemase